MKLMEIDPTVFTDTGCHSTMNADDIRLQLQLINQSINVWLKVKFLERIYIISVHSAQSQRE